MAVAIPVLFFLLMGGFDASLMIVNKMTAGYAVRHGARLAAELGGTQTKPIKPVIPSISTS
jgi:Flp pilus assembly protein TadG